MRAILAVSEYILNGRKCWNIGEQNDFLFDNKVRTDFFNQWSNYQTCIVDIETYEKIPKNSINKNFIIYTKNTNYIPVHNNNNDPVIVINDIFSLMKHFEELSKILKNPYDSILICGGKELYELFIPYCEYIYVSKNSNISYYDTTIHDIEIINLDLLDNWKVSSTQVVKDINTGELITLYRYHNTDVKNITILSSVNS